MDRNETTWCVLCGRRFVEEEIADASCCPACQYKGTPCATDRDLRVEINWHELRILGIWAENYASQIAKTDQNSNQFVQTIHAITRRIEAQYPEYIPLTLSGELGLVAKDYGKIETQGIAKPTLIPVNGSGAVGHIAS
jgi:hypothetical protein